MTYNQEELKKQAKKALNVGVGLAQMAGEQVTKALGGLEKDGYINRTEGKRLVKNLLGEVNDFQRKLSSRVDKGVKNIVKSSSIKSQSKTSAKRQRK